jgi:hypothetical protein
MTMRPERQFVSYSMLTGLTGDSSGTLALIITPAARAAMAKTARMPSKSGVKSLCREIQGKKRAARYGWRR